MDAVTAVLGIDIHCHILPDIDDGPRTLDESVKMAHRSALEGLGIVVATPHYAIDGDMYCIDDISRSFDTLKQELHHDATSIKLLHGAEIVADPLLPSLDAGTLKRLSINAGRYLLIEMPALYIPPYMEDLMYNLLIKGFIPIIAHPERNADVVSNPPAAYDLVEHGALLQLNAGSIAGRFGKEARNTALLLMKHGLADFIATDAHSSRKRAPRMMESFGIIADRFGYEQARRLWMDNPNAVISDDIVSAGHIIPFHRRLFGGWK